VLGPEQVVWGEVRLCDGRRAAEPHRVVEGVAVDAGLPKERGIFRGKLKVKLVHPSGSRRAKCAEGARDNGKPKMQCFLDTLKAAGAFKTPGSKAKASEHQRKEQPVPEQQMPANGFGSLHACSML